MIIKFFKLQFYFLTFERFPNLFRPSSRPYISGDTFRNISDHIFDESSTFIPEKVNRNDVVFVMTDLINVYFKIHHPRITEKYILITHNSDLNVDDFIDRYMDSKIIHWFSQNLSSDTSKATLIPKGIENLRYLKYGRKKWFKSSQKSKVNKILCSFNLYTNYQYRSNVQRISNTNEIVDISYFQTPEEYFYNLSKYKFNICPPGKGKDTSRIWESLLLNVFPVFELNSFTKQFMQMGIPGIYLDKWEDLLNFDETKLQNEYEKLINVNYEHFTLLKYWENIITSKKI